jgi:hypothetical protein
METQFFVVHAHYRVPLVQSWLIETTSGSQALEDHETGTFLSEEVKSGGDLIEELSDTEEITEEKARDLRHQEYTVVGYSANHPGGFTRVVKARTSKGAEKRFGGPNTTVLAVLEGKHQNLLKRQSSV